MTPSDQNQHSSDTDAPAPSGSAPAGSRRSGSRRRRGASKTNDSARIAAQATDRADKTVATSETVPTMPASGKRKPAGNRTTTRPPKASADSPVTAPVGAVDDAPSGSAKKRSTARGKAKPAAGRSGGSAKTVKVIPLGGLDGIGKNMTVVEYGNDMIVVDAGLMFPDDDHPGIDLILPDYTYVLENAHKLRAIVVTHGHEDHTGALPYLLKDLSVKPQIIATKLTLGLIGGKLEEHRIRDIKLVEVKSGDRVTKGELTIEFFHVNHSIPDAVGVFIETPIGNVLHTGDFKLDQTPIDGEVADYAALARFGQQGVMVLLSDSTNAETPGVTMSEAEVGRAMGPIIDRAKGKVIVASFSSHIHRLQQVSDAAIRSGRKVIVTGRSMLQNTEIARKLGYLHVDEDALVDAYDMKDIAPEDVVILCTGSQGEPLSALARMAAGEHRTIRITPEDTVIISATPVPGNEKAVSNVVNQLLKIGCDVYDKRRAGVHVSGHAAAEELKMMLNLTKPEYFMPVHGEARHLIAHRALAHSVGVPSDYIFILENGDVLEFDRDGAHISGTVPSGVIYVDGLNVGDMDSVVLRDRQHLAKDGIITVVLTIDARKGAVIGSPEIVLRGVSMMSEDRFVADIADRAKRSLEKTVKDRADLGVSRRAVREAVSQLIWERAKRRPMVIPVILEV